MEYNLADLFESVVDVVRDREALVCGDARLTYGELDARANKLGHHLVAAGVQPGDHVGIQLFNGTEYVETVLACVKIRAVPINVNYRYVASELAFLYENADLVALVFDASLADRALAAAPKAPTLRHLVSVGGPVEGAVSFADAVADQSEERNFPPRSADDHYIIYTGGTTGTPKGVMWRHEDLFFAGMAGGNPYGAPVDAPEELAPRVADGMHLVYFPAAPLMHGAAQLASFIGFFQGFTIVLVPRFDAEDVLRAIEAEKVNALSIVGDAMARPLADALAGPLSHLDVSSLGTISSAGALLSDAVAEALQEVLPTTMILNNYGASETGFNGTGAGDPGGLVRLSVNERTAVLSDAMRPVEPGSGEVGWVAQKRNVPLGYYKDPAASAGTFVELDGERWVIVGDRARVEADGTVMLLGRDSVCVNSGGEKVYAEEVEAQLKAHAAVADAIVVGIPDERLGQRVAAVIQLRPNVTRPGFEELQQHCREQLAGYKVPRHVVFVDEVRRSPSGKPDYPWAKHVALS